MPTMPTASLPRRRRDHDAHRSGRLDAHQQGRSATSKRRQLVEGGDIEESITAAAAIGDDRLQKMAGRAVNPETFTHGSSAQRVRWFKRGLEHGTLEACDTFSVRDL